MKIGEYATIDEIKQQSVHRWVVLGNLIESEYGVKGGTIMYIAETQTDAEDMAINLEQNGQITLPVCGALEALSLGGVIVE